MTTFQTRLLPQKVDTLAPDGSEIRLLHVVTGASAVHMTLRPGQVSKAISHKTVEEIWYIVSGQGEMWRKQGEQEAVVQLHEGVSLTIPVGTHFQFRATGPAPLCAVILTVPAWPGEQEAVLVPGHWPEAGLDGK